MSDLLLGVVQVISSPLIPPGRAYLVKAPIGYETTPLRALEFEPPRFDVPLSSRYGFEMRFPKPSARTGRTFSRPVSRPARPC